MQVFHFLFCCMPNGLIEHNWIQLYTAKKVQQNNQSSKTAAVLREEKKPSHLN